MLNSFKDLCAPQTFVVRDGTETQILASELVPGDVVKVTAGDKASRFVSRHVRYVVMSFTKYSIVCAAQLLCACAGESRTVAARNGTRMVP